VKRLQDKVAMITGGSRGIGRAIAEKLSFEGTHVTVGDIISFNQERETQQEHLQNIYYQYLDVTDTSSIKKIFERILQKFGHLDILVNNAGIMFEKRIEDTSEEDWDRMMLVNLKGVFFCTKYAIDAMRRSRGGAIINIGSIEGLSCNPNHTAYAASKGGVHALTRAIAVDLGREGIRCNAICPGWINTELNEGYFDQANDRAACERAIIALHPVGRMGLPEDIANMVCWLVSNEAGFVTGQEFIIDGGRLARLPLVDFDSMEKKL
jgi:NAD(P)-dependent dehydrogenase (short-subunit alcohol dehydrogenase family)